MALAVVKKYAYNVLKFQDILHGIVRFEPDTGAPVRETMHEDVKKYTCIPPYVNGTDAQNREQSVGLISLLPKRF